MPEGAGGGGADVEAGAGVEEEGAEASEGAQKGDHGIIWVPTVLLLNISQINGKAQGL